MYLCALKKLQMKLMGFRNPKKNTKNDDLHNKGLKFLENSGNLEPPSSLWVLKSLVIYEGYKILARKSCFTKSYSKLTIIY